MTADGLQSYCKACYALAAQQRRARIAAEGGAPERAEHEHAGVEPHMHEQARPCALRHDCFGRLVLWGAPCRPRIAARGGTPECAKHEHWGSERHVQHSRRASSPSKRSGGVAAPQLW